MSRLQPLYFEKVRTAAQHNWEYAQNNESTAGMRRNLFSQVCSSTRYVLSELLQNADDAHATWARVRIEDDVLYFQHNGDDFDEDTLGSLCNFGKSSKTNLHTIGFRGIGFKSTFSLGDVVEVVTQTISIQFHKTAFSVPVWVDSAPLDYTQVRVRIDSPEKTTQLAEDFERWAASPVALLFFKSIVRFEIGDAVLLKSVISDGPVERSSIVSLGEDSDGRLLYISSAEEAFPPEVLAEIVGERGSELDKLPPCAVEIVLGLDKSNRIYSVLPTDVDLRVPFSCNAPFMQDPSRSRIKDPAACRTNTWLLKRIGELAAQAMHSWLAHKDLSVIERAKAYGLLTEPRGAGESLGDICSRVIEESFLETIKHERLLLTQAGLLANDSECVSIPVALHGVWEDDEAICLFGNGHQHLLSASVQTSTRDTLRRMGMLHIVTGNEVLTRLQASPLPPRPDNISRLLALWAYVGRILQKSYPNLQMRMRSTSAPSDVLNLGIVPILGSMTLCRVGRVIVPSNAIAKSLTEHECGFVYKNVHLLDPEWSSLLTEETTDSASSAKDALAQSAGLLQTLGLTSPASVHKVVEEASNSVFAQTDYSVDGLLFARIAAKLNAKVPEDFRYKCRDEKWRTSGALGAYSTSSGAPLVYSQVPEIDYLLPKSYADATVIHDDYTARMTPPELETWGRWAASENSRLVQFSAPRKNHRFVASKQRAVEFILERGGVRPTNYPRKREYFRVYDFDFDDELRQFWAKLSEQDETTWLKIAQCIADAWDTRWVETLEAHVCQEGNDYEYGLAHGRLSSAWVDALRNTSCLPDTNGTPRIPSDLLRNTKETMSLEGVEPFIHPVLDAPENDAFLAALGVRTTATADKLLERLRLWASQSSPRIHEVVRLYDRLNSLLPHLPVAEVQRIIDAFADEHLLLGDDGSWHGRAGVFQRNPDELPGVVLVMPDVSDLPLWSRLRVDLQPTSESLLQWLKTLETGKLDQGGLQRVKSLLPRFAYEVWTELGWWVSSAGNIVDNRQLKWQSSTSSHSGLFAHVLDATADTSTLAEVQRHRAPFGSLPFLEQVISYRVQSPNREVSSLPEWTVALADALQRIRKPDSAEGDALLSWEKDMSTAQDLRLAKWCVVSELQTVPYIYDDPVGATVKQKVVWDSGIVYVSGGTARCYPELVKELSGRFCDSRIRDAVSFCVERSAESVMRYCEDNFELMLSELSSTLPKVETSTGIVEALNEADEDAQSQAASIGADDAPITQPDDETLESPHSHGGGRRVTSSNGTGETTSTGEYPNRVASFFRAMGYVSHNGDAKVYTDGSGSTIRKSDLAGVWDRYQDGEMKCHYWLDSGTLSRGIEVGHEVYSLMTASPVSWFVVSDDGKGGFACNRWDNIKPSLEVLPRSYRIRLKAPACDLSPG